MNTNKVTRSALLLAPLFAFVIAGLSSSVVSAQELNSNMGNLALSNDEPIQIESDRLEIDDANSTAVFIGNVQVLQGETLLQTKEMTVFYSEGGSVTSGATDIEKIIVSGRVLLRSGTQTATATDGVFNMEQETLVLNGSKTNEVVLTEGDNVFTGCKLTVKMATGNAQLERCANGRINIIISPTSK
jgi:lipopolysaccharide export system protein LptA